MLVMQYHKQGLEMDQNSIPLELCSTPFVSCREHLTLAPTVDIATRLRAGQLGFDS